MQGKKIVFTAPEQVETQVCDFNLILKHPTEVILKNRISLISPGTELACLSGGESWFPLPNTPGYIAVGEVQEKGAALTGIEPGALVFTYGPHAEYYKIDTTDRYSGICLPVPEPLPVEKAAFTRLATIALTAIRESTIELGDFVAVTGMGMVGNLAAQLAQLQGARVIGIDINQKRLELAQRCGIKSTLNSNQPDWPVLLREMRSGGISTLIDATGLSGVIQNALNALSKYGEAILLGSPRAAYEANLTTIFNKIHLPPFATLKGALEWRMPTFKNEFVKHSIERNSEIIISLIQEEKLVIDPLISHRLKADQASEAYSLLKNDPENTFGVLFDWS